MLNIRSATPKPNFEPEEEWKISLRQRIEDTLKPAVAKLEGELAKRPRDFPPPEDSKLGQTTIMLWLNYVARRTRSIVSCCIASAKRDGGQLGKSRWEAG